MDSGTIRPIHRAEQPPERRRDTTYYNPKPKQKRADDGTITYRIRGTIGGDKINYPGATTAQTAAMPVFKALLHSTISTDASWMTLDIRDYYLGTNLPRPEYVRIHTKFIPTTALDLYSLYSYITDNSILFEVNKGMYGLPQAGLLAQQKLIAHLAANEYTQTAVPCLFRHKSNGTTFALVVDDFGVKYTSKAGADHLIATLQQHYQLKVDWTGNKYLGFAIDFDRPARTVKLSMPGYIDKFLQRFAPDLTKGANSPALYVPPSYGATTQAPEQDSSPALPPEEKQRIQEIVGCLLYYARGVDPTMLPAVTHIASLQSHPTEHLRTRVDRLLQYCTRHRNHSIAFRACDMVLHVQTDASYLSRTDSRSVAGFIAYLGDTDKPEQPNGALHYFSNIIDVVVASAGEAEYAALFMGGQEAAGLRDVLIALDHPQPTTTILCDNRCAIGIATDTVKAKRTKSIDMRFHWIRDRVRQGMFQVLWRPGSTNLADFFTKALPVHAHRSAIPALVYSPPTKPTTIHTKHSARGMLHRISQRTPCAPID